MSVHHVTIYEPSFKLRSLIGKNVNLNDVFNKERIAACQKLVDEARSSFFDIALIELNNLEDIVRKNSSSSRESRLAFETIVLHITNIRGFAELFQFNLIASLCGHIIDYCYAGKRSQAVRFKLIDDLCKMLRLAISHAGERSSEARFTLIEDLCKMLRLTIKVKDVDEDNDLNHKLNLTLSKDEE